MDGTIYITTISSCNKAKGNHLLHVQMWLCKHYALYFIFECDFFKVNNPDLFVNPTIPDVLSYYCLYLGQADGHESFIAHALFALSDNTKCSQAFSLKSEVYSLHGSIDV